jgi:hypothetical protein
MASIYAVLALVGVWVLNFFFRKWLDLVIWPRVSDRWASWSQSRLRNKIELLEYRLSNPITGEEVIVYGVRGILHLLINVFGFVVCTLTPGTFRLPKQISPAPVQLPNSFEIELLAWLRLFTFCMALFVGQWYFYRLSSRYQRWKYPNSYQRGLEKRIAKLKEQFARKYPDAKGG